MSFIKQNQKVNTDLTINFIEEIFKDKNMDEFSIRLWDGTVWPKDEPRRTTLVLKHPGSLRHMLLKGTELGIGEAYLHDDFDVEGDFEAIFNLAEDLAKDASGVLKKVRAARSLLQLPEKPRRKKIQREPARFKGKPHSIERDRQAITYHYDVSNDFYSLWLDKRMVYSCAYFQDPGDELDVAQQRKLDYISRKLRLKPGQRLLDIGCGWGGLVLYAAEHYGVDATGITLSQPQADLAMERIARAGLSDRCRVLLCDYREMDDLEGFDALVSVGMFEHVGARLLPEYFRLAWNLVRREGVFLNHGIASRPQDKAAKARSFSDAYVFPDGELAPISTTLRAAEEAGFEVRDVESLREHYAITLRNWVQRLESRKEGVLNTVDDSVYRVWRLFMSGSANGFSVGRLNVYQTLLVKTGEAGQSGLPLTREDWYR